MPAVFEALKNLRTRVRSPQEKLHETSETQKGPIGNSQITPRYPRLSRT